LDLIDNSQPPQNRDIHSTEELERILEDKQSRKEAKVRLYIVESTKDAVAGIIEALGSSLRPDPRFFTWVIEDPGTGDWGVIWPSEYEQLPFTGIGFPVMESIRDGKVREFCQVHLYILPGSEKDEWTGKFCLLSLNPWHFGAWRMNSPYVRVMLMNP
jgi:hypothetical protein